MISVELEHPICQSPYKARTGPIGWQVGLVAEHQCSLQEETEPPLLPTETAGQAGGKSQLSAWQKAGLTFLQVLFK